MPLQIGDTSHAWSSPIKDNLIIMLDCTHILRYFSWDVSSGAAAALVKRRLMFRVGQNWKRLGILLIKEVNILLYDYHSVES